MHGIGLSLSMEIALSLLLVATLVYCALLERKLTALRKSQDKLKDFIGELNAAITTAGSSMRMLKSTAAGAAETLDERVATARGLIDELSLLTAAGERIATRIERGGEQSPRRPANGVLPAAASRPSRSPAGPLSARSAPARKPVRAVSAAMALKGSRRRSRSRVKSSAERILGSFWGACGGNFTPRAGFTAR